jgi:hypothetical protein
MSDVRIVINEAAFEDIRNAAGVKADLLARAKRIRDASGAGYELEVEQTDTRARVTIWPETHEAVRDNAAHNTLLRNLDKGR